MGGVGGEIRSGVGEEVKVETGVLTVSQSYSAPLCLFRRYQVQNRVPCCTLLVWPARSRSPHRSPGPVREGNVCGSGVGPRPFPRSDAKVSVQSTEYRTKGLHFGHFPLSACMSKTVEGRGGGAPASPSLIAIGQPALPTTWKPCLPVMWPTFCAPLPVRWNMNRLPLGKTCSY